MTRLFLIGVSLIMFACESKEKLIDKSTQSTAISSPTSEQLKLREFDDKILSTLDSAYRVKPRLAQLVTLDSIACFSDGELTEGVDYIAVRFYETNKVAFFKSLKAKKLPCLEKAFIRGMSINASQIEQPLRPQYRAEVRLAAAKSFGDLSQAEKAYADSLIAQIKPELFD